jgi:hypothetical protein
LIETTIQQKRTSFGEEKNTFGFNNFNLKTTFELRLIKHGNLLLVVQNSAKSSKSRIIAEYFYINIDESFKQDEEREVLAKT